MSDPMTLRALRAAARDVHRELGGMVLVAFHPTLEADVRALPNFISREDVEKYGCTPVPGIGCTEIFRFEPDNSVAPGAWTLRT